MAKPAKWIECPDCEGEGIEVDYDTGDAIGICEECEGAGGWEEDEDDEE